MKISIILSSVLLTFFTSVFAANQYLATFELKRGVTEIDRGKILVTDKRQTWSRGLKRSYLLLRCQPSETGKIQKLLSTEEHFSGLTVSHQLVDGNVDITVRRSSVTPRLDEIHALPKGECKELLPLVTIVTKQYSFSASEGARGTWLFSENATFRITGELIREE